MARSIFTITAATDNAKPDQSGRAEVALTVTNISGRNLRGRAKVVPQDPADNSWFQIAGNAERDFTIGGTQQFTVHITVPKTAKPGKHSFRLDAVSTELPDEEYTQGPNIGVAVTGGAPAPHKSTFPVWLIPVLAIVLLLVLGGGGWLIYYLISPSSSSQTSGGTGGSGGTKIAPVVVPNVLGQKPADAQAALTAAGLKVSPKEGVVASLDIPQGTVAQTKPAAGQKVAPGTVVILYVVGVTMKVPTYSANTSLVAMIDKLLAMALNVKLQFNGNGPLQKIVLATSPGQNSPILKGEYVVITAPGKVTTSGGNGPYTFNVGQSPADVAALINAIN